MNADAELHRWVGDLAHGRSMGKGWVSFTPPEQGEATLAEVRRWLEVLVSS